MYICKDENNVMAKQFFNRTLGRWESHRTYLYAKSGKVINSITIFEWTRDKDGIYTVNWDNQAMKADGSMSIRIASDFVLERSRGYFTDDVTESRIQTCSRDNLRTLTCYGGKSYDEKIDFLSDDLRLRRTIATDDKTGEVFLVGNYVEKRLCPVVREEVVADEFLEV